MLGQDMLDEMHDHEFDDIEDTRLLSIINDQYHDVCSRFLWPFLEVTDTITPDSSTGVVTWPDDLAHIKKVFLLTDTKQNNLLERDDLFDMQTNELPAFLAYKGQELGLTYFLVPEDLLVDTEPIFSRRHHRVVVLGALARAYYMTDDTQLGQLFEDQFEKRIMRMANDMLRRDVAPRKVYDVG